MSRKLITEKCTGIKTPETLGEKRAFAEGFRRAMILLSQIDAHVLWSIWGSNLKTASHYRHGVKAAVDDWHSERSAYQRLADDMGLVEEHRDYYGQPGRKGAANV